MSNASPRDHYAFDAFTTEREAFDYYADDAFLQTIVRHHAGAEFDAMHPVLLDFSRVASTRWRKLAQIASAPEARPYMVHFDGHGNRIDRIVRPAETLQLERELFQSAIFSARTSPWERFAKSLIAHQNGEAGVICPMICTEGFINMLESHGKDSGPEVQAMLTHCKEGVDGDFGIAAQYLTEAQGGSDLPANIVEARPQADGSYRLYGEKFFCSACQADYAIVTAKVSGQSELSTFAVPSWLPGDQERERRNGYRIRKLKVKLGTVELPTSEIDYDGAVAYAVGELGKGVKNVVGHVLTLSRLGIGSSSAAAARRVSREAAQYAAFRKVFGARVCDLPLSAIELARLDQLSKEMIAGAFAVYDQYLSLGQQLTAGLPRDEDLSARRAKMMLRISVMLQKLVTTRDAIDQSHRALGIFAGHGIMMDFSDIPRMLRDALVNEQWEGPRGLLLHQIHQDLSRVSQWYPAKDFVADLLHGHDQAVIAECATALEEILATPMVGLDPKTIAAAERWDRLATELWHAFQRLALQIVEQNALRKPTPAATASASAAP
jgi:alkylation response protein AidB-like acyl-CoA dehydrogenase